MAKHWSEADTTIIVQAVAGTKDPTIAACAVIGAMVGIIEQWEGKEFARMVIGEIAAMSFSPDAANRNRREDASRE